MIVFYFGFDRIVDKQFRSDTTSRKWFQHSPPSFWFGSTTLIYFLLTIYRQSARKWTFGDEWCRKRTKTKWWSTSQRRWNLCSRYVPNHNIIFDLVFLKRKSFQQLIILKHLLASSSTGIAAVGERFGAVSEQAKNQNWRLWSTWSTVLSNVATAKLWTCLL